MNTFLFTTMKPIAPLLIVILVPALLLGIPFALSIKKQWKNDRPKAVGRIRVLAAYLLGLIIGYGICYTKSPDLVFPETYVLTKDFSAPVPENFSDKEKMIEEVARYIVDIANRSLSTGEDSMKFYNQYFTVEPPRYATKFDTRLSTPDDKSLFLFDLQKANELLAIEKERPIQLRYFDSSYTSCYSTTRPENKKDWIEQWMVFLATGNAKNHQAVLFLRLDMYKDKDSLIHVGILPGRIGFSRFSTP